MIRILDTSQSDFNVQLNRLLDRETEEDGAVEGAVREIIASVRARGDAALLEYTNRFDNLSANNIEELELSDEDLASFAQDVDKAVSQAIQDAAARIRQYHEKEIARSWRYQETDGTILGQKIAPIDRVGLYVPGGKAAYPSSVLMTAIPAKVAGVEEIVMTVPTPNGEVNPAVMLAAKISGVNRVFFIGGAQAVAAMAYGTETVPNVDKIVGPGNIYVATAKKLVFGKVGIDMIAGPSEVVVICDDSVDPEWVAMDMFAQAEHDELAQSIAITDSSQMLESIKNAIRELQPNMGRSAIIRESLSKHGALIKVDSIEQAVEVANRIAPEHLELMVDEPDRLVEKVKHAGAIFMGAYSAESLGDYCAGPNHVLPTAGTARFSSPLGVYDYQKRSSVIHASRQGAEKMAGIASVLARCEGLTAHARSAEFRMHTLTNSNETD